MGMTGEQAYVLAKKLIEAGGGGGGTVDAYTKTQTDNLLMQKVDKEVGKGLFSGSYNDLSDAPTIPSKTSELQNDSGYLTEHQDLTDYAKKTDIPTTVAELTDSGSYAKKTDIPVTLPANGGNSDTVNNHTVESNVPVDAKFTDTVYDDTEVKGSIAEINSNLQSKCDNVSQLPQYTYHFGSFDGMVNGDAFSSLKALRKITREPFKRGSLISIETEEGSGAYETFIIGSTDADFFRGLCLSFYSEPYYFRYTNGVWEK